MQKVIAFSGMRGSLEIFTLKTNVSYLSSLHLNHIYFEKYVRSSDILVTV